MRHCVRFCALREPVQEDDTRLFFELLVLERERARAAIQGSTPPAYNIIF